MAMTTDDKHGCGLTPEDYPQLTGLDGDWRDGWWEDDYLAFLAEALPYEDGTFDLVTCQTLLMHDK